MKYAPANADGLKPWVVTVSSSWGPRQDQIVYAKTAAAAKYKAIGRQQHTYGTVRRATPGDLTPTPDKESPDV